jgi:thymidylate synthase
VVTTKQLFWKLAIAEMLGYIRGYQSAAQFRALGCNTWNANANKNQAWLDNRLRFVCQYQYMLSSQRSVGF